MGILDILGDIESIEQFYDSLEIKKEYMLDLYSREAFLFKLTCEGNTQFALSSRDLIR